MCRPAAGWRASVLACCVVLAALFSARAAVVPHCMWTMQLTPEFSSVPTSCKSPKLNNTTQALCLACNRAGQNRQRCLATTAWVFHRADKISCTWLSKPAVRGAKAAKEVVFTLGANAENSFDVALADDVCSVALSFKQRLPADANYSAAAFWAIGGNNPSYFRQPPLGYCTLRGPGRTCTTTLRRSFAGRGASPVAGAVQVYGPVTQNALHIVPVVWVKSSKIVAAQNASRGCDYRDGFDYPSQAPCKSVQPPFTFLVRMTDMLCPSSARPTATVVEQKIDFGVPDYVLSPGSRTNKASGVSYVLDGPSTWTVAASRPVLVMVLPYRFGIDELYFKACNSTYCKFSSLKSLAVYQCVGNSCSGKFKPPIRSDSSYALYVAYPRPFSIIAGPGVNATQTPPTSVTVNLQIALANPSRAAVAAAAQLPWAAGRVVRIP